MATLLTPLFECFDRWDAPGLSNDTEFAVFALVLILSLVLLMCRLISSLALLIRLACSRISQGRDPSALSGAWQRQFIVLSPPPLLLPLRI